MAEMTVDRIVERAGDREPCRTLGARIGVLVDPDDLPRVEGVPEESYEALADRYGSSAEAVLAVAAEDGRLAQPIIGGLPDILAEVVWSARSEQAGTLGDVLFRRTRLALLAGRELTDPATGAAERVAQVLGDELGWDLDRRASELSDFFLEAAEEGVAVPIAVTD
jgi:glycerol-3-phosphate dehydrogenase